MGTKEGAKKASATVRKRYGDDYYVNLGRLGGVRRKPGNGFAIGETARKFATCKMERESNAPSR